ncbi:MAG: acetyl-CoA carboxylase biotin carboxyl carrier protein [Bacteroidota bacterium]|nr:acetyl-CoA carboxylase biotin carboxyl carrier protein [Bacteroidota bacterium]MDP4231312.1 acetyl-CoA carboxylase biotin carboxyl carrier protein [Bacteroidota bacterium]MDP4236694.1 acetyl-CoA carboxylase biotin carboxyl carrier protein [Bacteroidota bacterium]
MDLSYLEKILRLFDESTLTELEIEEDGSQIRLARQKEPAAPMQFAMPQFGYGAPPAAAPSTQAPAVSAGESSSVSSAKTHEVKSPIVGTLYRAPSPDADPYVQVGQQVESGTTLCIIEAMKLMNEIESDASGKIIKILVENGQPVEYGQVLFILEVG